jgi:hypothetical protein
MALRLGLEIIVCPIEDVLTPLNCCEVSTGNSYKVLPGKYKTTLILMNVCLG